MSTYGTGTYGAGTYGGTGGAPPSPGPFGFAALTIKLSFESASATPIWVDFADRLRGFSFDRGKDNETSEVQPATGSVTLSNADRVLDPTNTSSPYTGKLRARNRIWIQVTVEGATYDEFQGYVETYQPSWTLGSNDATVVISFTDEFKVLSLVPFPQMDPPSPIRGGRDPTGDTGTGAGVFDIRPEGGHMTYEEVVKFDQAAGYWRFPGSATGAARLQATVGKDLTWDTGYATSGVATPIVGDDGGSLFLFATQYVYAADLSQGESGDAGDLGEFSVEFWWRGVDGLPTAATTDYLILGPISANAQWQYTVQINSSGQFVWGVDTNGTKPVVTGGTVSANDTAWYHVVCTCDFATARLYVDGAQVATAASSNACYPIVADSDFVIGEPGSEKKYRFDEVAFYRYTLPATRVLAHYVAGAQRGFPRLQTASQRIDAVLTTAGNQAPRALGTTTRQMTAVFQNGQPALEEVRRAARIELPDGMYFISKSGTHVLLGNAHRASAPYNTVQAKFGDNYADATEIPYQLIDPDFSDQHLANSWSGSRQGGPLVTVSDPTSIGIHYEVAGGSLTDLALVSDTDVTNILTALVTKFKDTMPRIRQIEVKLTEATIAHAVLARDLGDRIRVLHTPPGGGPRWDQSPWIQKIHMEWTVGKPITVGYALSPL